MSKFERISSLGSLYAKAAANAVQDATYKAKKAVAEKTGEADPDPEQLIFDWCEEVDVPIWKEPHEYNSCFQCGSSFKPNNQHNCHLCGEMFCSECTKRHHLPPKYKIKMTKGAVRVCLTCIRECLNRKQDAIDSGFVIMEPGLVERDFVLFPPVWENEAKFRRCQGCSKTGIKPYNCRICGWLFCVGCTTKRDVPRVFRHKPKAGPVRVCTSCNTKCDEGAVLSNKKLEVSNSKNGTPVKQLTREDSTKPAFNYAGRGDDDEDDDFARRLTQGSKKKENQYGVVSSPTGSGKAKVFIKQSAASPRGKSPAASGNAALTEVPPMLLQIRWENAVKNILEEEFPGNMTLQDLDRQFKRSQNYPEFKFKYISRMEPIPDMWWDVFEVRHLAPVLTIRKVDSLAMSTKDKIQSAKGVINPYSKEFRKDKEVEELDRKEKLNEKKNQKPKFRKPGDGFKKAKMGVTKATAKAAPELRVGHTMKRDLGDVEDEIEVREGEDVLAARARFFAEASPVK